MYLYNLKIIIRIDFSLINNLRQFGISNPLSFSSLQGERCAKKHSKAYSKRALNSCEGETQHVPINEVGVLHYLLFALYMGPASFHFFTFSLFHLFNLSPLCRGRFGGAVSASR